MPQQSAMSEEGNKKRGRPSMKSSQAHAGEKESESRLNRRAYKRLYKQKKKNEAANNNLLNLPGDQLKMKRKMLESDIPQNVPRKRGRPSKNKTQKDEHISMKEEAPGNDINRRVYQRQYQKKRRAKHDTQSKLELPGRDGKTQNTDPSSSVKPMIIESSDTRHPSPAFSNSSTGIVPSNGIPVEQQSSIISNLLADYLDMSSAACHWRHQISIMRLNLKPAGYELLKWSKRCQTCGIELLDSENLTFRCNNGRRLLPPLEKLPSTLEHLYSIHEFGTSSRIINNLFCFTALGVKGNFVDLKLPACVAIMGRTYHCLLSANEPNSTLHWYIYDETRRFELGDEMRVPSHWIMQVATTLDAINPYVKELRTVKELHPCPAKLTLADAPASNEFAAIIHANNSITIEPRSAMVWMRREHRPVFISILDPMYEPLQYPLFYPHGTPGWHPRNEHKMSQIDWYRTRLLHEPRFLQLGRLCNEYLVDIYSRVEEERLNYIATEGYRRNLAQHEEDFIDDEDEDARQGTLPASFLGCRRWCSVQVADSLALSREYGKPSFFITMTTNPNWPEIRSKLAPGQNASDISTIVVRSFHQRLQHAKSVIRKHFGPISYLMHVIEFQKRGLPHSHIVTKTKHELPISMIDDLISAELPTDETLRAQVEKYMIHNHSKRCLKENGQCCYGYPKPINQKTYIDEKGYVQYRRRTEADINVVPYMPFLLRELDCHVYADVASTVHIFAYLYGYIYKGFDTTRFHIETSRKV